jgi:hypothetical protein
MRRSGVLGSGDATFHGDETVRADRYRIDPVVYKKRGKLRMVAGRLRGVVTGSNGLVRLSLRA